MSANTPPRPTSARVSTKPGHRAAAKPSDPPQGGVGDVAEDMLNLAELQAKLLIVDLKEAGQRARIPLAVLAIAIGLLLGCFPVFLLGLGHLLIHSAGWGEAPAFLTAAGGGALLAVGLAVGAGMALRNGASVLARSQTEAVRNFTWIKTALSGKKRGY